jgi:hypothetical protein
MVEVTGRELDKWLDKYFEVKNSNQVYIVESFLLHANRLPKVITK